MGDLAAFSLELRDTARSLRQAGDTDLARQLQKHMKDATKPVQAQVITELPDHMPRRYAGVLARDLRITTSARLTGSTGARVTIKAATRSGMQRKLGRLDNGGLAHPFFGSRKTWYSQRAGVKAGFFSEPIEHDAPEIRAEIRAAMDEVAAEAARR